MCPSWPKEHDWKSCKSLTRLLGFESPHLRHRRHKLHSACGDFLLSFYRKSPRAHYAAPPLPKKLTLFGDPDICFCCKDRDSNRAIRRIETVRWTVSLPAGVPKKALAFNGRSPHLRHRRHGLHIVRDDFFISKKSSAHSFRRSSSPQKAYAFRGPRFFSLTDCISFVTTFLLLK